jgi:hypothetical protein
VLRTFLRVSPARKWDEVVDGIHGLTRGNPLFLVELVEGLSRAGALRLVDGRWTLEAEDLPEVMSEAPTVTALIRTRLVGLPEPARLVIAHLARQAGPTQVARLRRLTGLASSPYIRALAVLADHRLVVWIDDQRVDLAHDRFREVGRAMPAPSLPRRVALLRIAAVGLLLLGSIAIGGWLTGGAASAPDPLPFGGGLLLAQAGDSIVELRPASTTGSWTLAPASIPVPPPVTRYRIPFRSGGRIVWMSVAQDLANAAFPVRVHLDGTLDTIFRTPLDDALAHPAPDGSSLVLTTENPETPAYDHHVLRTTPDGGDPGVLYTSPGYARVAGWSPDATRILVRVDGRPDTLTIFRPDGSDEGTVTLQEIRAATWCGPDRIAVLQRAVSGSRIVLVDAMSLEVAPVPVENVLSGPITCSPDGTALVFPQAVERRSRTSLHELGTGRTRVLPELPDRTRWVRWVPDGIRSTPRAVGIAGLPAVVSWGERLQLHLLLDFPDGSREHGRGVWTSADPAVASVSTDGVLYANRPGTTRIVVRHSAGPADTATLTVSGSPGRRVLLSEDFQRIDPEEWINGGYPPAEVVTRDGGPALRLDGDGRWTDGLLGAARKLPRGATVEAEFRLRPDREDRQRVTLCLVQAGLRRTEVPDDLESWSYDQLACVRYPLGAGARLDSTGVRFTPYGAADLPELLPTDDWVHVGVQLRADGEVTYLVGRQPVFVGPVALRNEPGDRWRVRVTGASVGTEVLVRNLILWEGPRYLPPSGDDAESTPPRGSRGGEDPGEASGAGGS